MWMNSTSRSSIVNGLFLSALTSLVVLAIISDNADENVGHVKLSKLDALDIETDKLTYELG